MKRPLWRTILIVLLLGVCVCGLVLIVRQAIDYRHAEESHNLAVSVVSAPASPAVTEASGTPPPTAPEESGESGGETPASEAPSAPEYDDPTAVNFLSYNLGALQEINPDVLGWISVPGTDISYPLLQTGDNSTYLNRSWDGKKTTSGSIFLDYKSNAGLQDFNTIVYGHNMKNGSMFAALLKYRQKSYYSEHPEVWIVTADGAYRYLIFSAYEARVDSDTYAANFADGEAAQAALDYYIRSSCIKTGVEPGTSDRLLTLSTCVGGGRYSTRWVVQAVLTAEYPRG